MQWFTIVQTVVMALAAAGVALLYRGFQTGKWVQNVDAQQERIAEIHRRLDRAGEKMSELATDVQHLPERMREEFVTKEIFEIRRAVDQERRDELRQEFRKEDTLIWEEIRRLKSRR